MQSKYLKNGTEYAVRVKIGKNAETVRQALRTQKTGNVGCLVRDDLKEIWVLWNKAYKPVGFEIVRPMGC